MDRPSRGGGPKKARPRQRRQADQLRGGSTSTRQKRAPVPARTPAYSHIQVVSQPEEPADPTTYGRLSTPSFVKKSLQEDIIDGLVEAAAISTTTAPTSVMAPLSFAQAVMTSSAQPRRGSSIDSTKHVFGLGEIVDSANASIKDDGVAGAVGGILKVANRRSKQSSSADLKLEKQQGAEGAANEHGGSASHEEDATAVSGRGQLRAPAQHPKATLATPAANISPNSPPSRLTANTVSPPASIESRQHQHRAAAEHTSPSRSFYLGSPPSHKKSRRYTSETDSSIIHKEDSDETKGRIENIMARFDEVFDAEEWEDAEELADVTATNSPEHLAVEPQRVTYTTVGSVAKSNSVPTFTPPIRIQREGANRRLPILPTMRAADSFFARQQSMNTGPGFALPPMNPHLGQLNQTHQSAAAQAGVNLALLEQLSLTDQEQEILESYGNSPASVRSGNVQVSGQAQHLVQGVLEDGFGLKRTLKDETFGQNPSLPGSSSFAGLNKMQTLQRLAQFENPAQGFAKERLAEFKAVKMQQQQQQAMENGLALSTQASRFDFNSMRRQNSSGGLVQSNQYRPENENPLHRRPSYDSSYQQNQYSGPLSVPPGYPQPLTAGPPGQRQNTIAVSKFGWTGQNNNTTGNPHLQTYVTAENNNSPWYRDGFAGYDTHRSDTFRSLPNEDSYIRDTSTAVEIAKYYPTGFPSGFQMRKTRSLGEREKQMNLLGAEDFMLVEKELTEEMSNKRWYGGLDRLGMSFQDHMDDFEMREKAPHPGPIQRPTTEFLAARKALSVTEVEKMTLPEIAEPLIAGLFGTLLTYADNVVRPENRKLMSRFSSSPAWALDTSHEGRKSVYGDDWAAPPKRLGRDPRYQPSPLSEVWGHDGQGRHNY